MPRPNSPKLDLRAAAARLVEAAVEAESEAAQRKAVRDVLGAFEKSDAASVRTALKTLAGGLEQTQGRGTQVLFLTLGALVESGADPDAAWPAVERGLKERLRSAAEFARALLKRAPEDGDEAALAEVATEIARSRPRDAAAWQELPSHCLAALACLTRSASARKKIRADKAVVETTLALEEAVDEAGLLGLAIRLLENEEIVVYHVPSKRAFRMTVSDVATNAELAVLVAAALFEAKKIPATVKLAAPALATLRGETAPGAKPKELPVPFDLAPWTSLRADGTLPPHEHHVHVHDHDHDHDHDDHDHDHDHDHAHDHLASFEGAPADLPPLGGTRFVAIDDAAHDVRIHAEPTLPALHPKVVLRGELPAAALAKLLQQTKKKAPARKPKRATKGR